MALFVDLVALSNGLHGSVQMDSVALFSWIGWLRHHGILTPFNASHLLYVIIHSINFKFKHITYYQVDIFIFNYNCMSIQQLFIDNNQKRISKEHVEF